MTRHYVLSTLSVQYWEEKIELDQYCIEELRFWRTNLNSLKVRYCFLIHTPQRFVYADSSATGCGAEITLNEEHICHRLWEPSECSKSSTWREQLPPLTFLSNRSPQFCRVPSLSGLWIVSQLRKSSKWEA